MTSTETKAETKWTPGPWFARQQFHAYDKKQSMGWIIETENKSRIGWSSYADAETNDGEREPHPIGGANAHLIAAAPLLASAAEMAENAIDEFEFLYHKADGDITEQIAAVCASLPALRAALAAAKGETP